MLPVIGAERDGQVQDGAVILRVVVQPLRLEDSVTFVPDGIPLIVLVVLFTMPEELLTVPLLEKLMLNEARSAEQVVVVKLKVGTARIIKLTGVLVLLLQPLIVFLESA